VSDPRLYHEDQRDKPVNLERVLRRQSVYYQVGVRWLPAREDVSPGAEELLEDVSKQRSEGRDREK
jgi:hypothetical protein